MSTVHVVYCEWGGIPEVVGIYEQEADAKAVYEKLIVENGTELTEEEARDEEWADFDNDIVQIDGRYYLRADEKYTYYLAEMKVISHELAVECGDVKGGA